MNLGIAILHNYYFLFSKVGADGTGKANVHPRTDSKVYGVLYKMNIGCLLKKER